MTIILFDTSISHQYYKDVHNVLALPSGDLYTYDYRAEHLSDEVRARFDGGGSLTRVLIAYAEAHNFKRGDGAPAHTLTAAEKFVPLRWASVRELRVRDGRYHIDLVMGDYPDAAGASYGEIWRELTAASTVPFRVWAAEVNEQTADRAFGQLGSWGGVIDALNADTQFRGDSFWRIEGLRRAGELVQPRLDALGGEISARSERYLREFDRVVLRIEARDRHDDIALKVEPQFEVSTEPSGRVVVSGANTRPLRRQEIFDVELYVEPSSTLTDSKIELKLASLPKRQEYVSGPEISLVLRSHKHPLAIPAIVLGGVLAVGFGAAVFGVRDEPLLAAFFAILAAVGLAVSVYALTGKLQLGGKAG